jgi:enoyl-CoA hydratase/carnithine racemase
MSTPVQVTTADRITTIRLARPEKKNALTLAMYRELIAALDGASADPQVRAVIIAGDAACFTSGNDVGDFVKVAQGGGDVTAPLDFLRRLVTFDKPLIAAVSGLAIGIGTTLLLHCDLVFASPSATFKTPFVDLALVPEGGSSVLLPALVGARRANQLLLLGEKLDAPTALAWGLVNAVEADVEAAARAAASRLATCAPAAVRASKALLTRAGRDVVLEAIRVEGEVFGARLRSPEAMVALQAMMMKKAPDFSSFV